MSQQVQSQEEADKEKLHKDIARIDPEVIMADGFEGALLGLLHPVDNSRPKVAVYSHELCIAELVRRDGMDESAAHEFFDFNVSGAYVGPRTPLFV